MEQATILSVQVGRVRRLGSEAATDPMQRPWTSGILKAAVSGPVWFGVEQIDGDEQANRDAHGGQDKAVCSYPVEHLRAWAAELGLGEITNGGFGENLTLSNLLEDGVCIGDSFRAGTVVLQVSQPRGPCWKLARRWQRPDLAIRADESGRTGWYFRVLQEGHLQAGDTLELLERPNPQWTIQRAYQALRAPAAHRQESLVLAALTQLSAASRESLLRGLEQGKQAPRRSTLIGDNEG